MSERKSICLSSGLEILDSMEGDGIQSSDQAPNRSLIMSNAATFFFELDFTFTKEQLFQLVDNFKKNVRGKKVPINYAHPKNRLSSGGAAGWVNDLDLVEDRNSDLTKVYATLEWTKQGSEDVMSKKYLYSSVGVYFNYLSPKDGKTDHGIVLFELSLTNDPIDINIGTIKELSANNQRKNAMSEEMKKQLEQNKKELSASFEQNKLLASKIEVLTLSVKAIQNEKEETKKKLASSERSADIDRLIVEGKMLPAKKEAAISLSAEAYKGFKLSLPDKPIYEKSSASGKNPSNEEKTLSAEDELISLSSELRKGDISLSYTDSITKVMIANPELAKRYNQGV